jgi:CBS domain-containing protein
VGGAHHAALVGEGRSVTRRIRSRDAAAIQPRRHGPYNGGMKIKDLMAMDVVAIDPDASLEEAAA